MADVALQQESPASDGVAVAPPSPPDEPAPAVTWDDATGLAAADAPPSAQAPEWETLRWLLLHPEQRQLSGFAERFNSPERHAEEVSKVLPDAIILRQKAKDQRLVKAIQPTFEEALRNSIKKDPKPFIDAVAPVMGAAIRKAITEALSAMMESLNRTLDNSVSLQSFQWRLEAMRTGKPFAEIVMLHTVEYRVEQVFLIHRETGLLLQHAVAAPQGAVQAPIWFPVC